VSDYAGRVDYLFANPPCAPWSNAGNQIDRLDWRLNPLTACWRKTAELVWQLQPKVAHIESVRPLYYKGREMVEQIAQEGLKHGYQTVCILEDAYNTGIPQRRPRFVLCLTKFEYLASATNKPEVTPAETLKKLKKEWAPPENKRRASPELEKCIEYKVLVETEPGGRLSRTFLKMFPKVKAVDGKIAGRPSMLKYRLHPDEPSPTQPGGAIIFHHKEDRYLTIGEAAALCGYPADYEFVGSVSNAYAQMGKAVLPPVGEHLAHDALATVKAKKKLKDLKPLEVVIGRSEVTSQAIDLTPQKRAAPVVRAKDIPFEPDPPKKAGNGKPSKAQVVRPAKVGIGLYIRELLTGKVDRNRIVELVRKKFPQSKATVADVAWNIQHMTKPGGKFYGMTFRARKN
jgi:DNA (cytosine-5)-methyltransferase 1